MHIILKTGLENWPTVYWGNKKWGGGQMTKDLNELSKLADTEPAMLEALKQAIDKRRKAWAMEQQAEMMKTEANQEIEAFLTSIGIEGAGDAETGFVVKVAGVVNQRFSKKKIQEVMLNGGIPATTVAKWVEEATEEKQGKGYIRYDPPKNG